MNESEFIQFVWDTQANMDHSKLFSERDVMMAVVRRVQEMQIEECAKTAAELYVDVREGRVINQTKRILA